MNEIIELSTGNKNEIIDITSKIEQLVNEVEDGICLIYVPHTTAAVTVNENSDENVKTDVLSLLDELVPRGKWIHDKVDGNGEAHIKSAIIGPSEIVPVKNGKLELGMWQGIMFCEFDGPRERKVVAKIINN